MLPVVAGEILLRGFAFPALCAWKGPIPAALIVSVLFGGLTSLAGQPGVAVLSMLLGLALCALYVATGSLLPGIALASGGLRGRARRRVRAGARRDRRPGARLRARLGGARRHPRAARAWAPAAAAAARQRGVRRARRGAAPSSALAGCGSGGGPLELVSAEPPAGAQAAGKRAERQGGNDPDAGERIYRLTPAGGRPA